MLLRQKEKQMTKRSEHSPLGGSGAPRWMKCAGSVSLSYGVKDKESEYAKLGTAAHALAELCLKDRTDAWQWIETAQEGSVIFVDKDMADAVQVYLSAVREWHPDRNQGNTWIERRFHCPTIHKYHYGTADLVHLDKENKTLHVWDYKHGAGIVVEPKKTLSLCITPVVCSKTARPASSTCRR
ncbi:hypothetical protein LCGC14_2175490 [marine sediment metagenome]|uniref:PD-(D/E)XK endonuclease-like domain-containing protein n=1 Tax=marine sediment metagenome TaxID=412755 RepID=A0A0F9DNW4_9ZZZZ